MEKGGALAERPPLKPNRQAGSKKLMVIRIISFAADFNKLFDMGRDYPWPKPEGCPFCNGCRIWGHGFLLVCFDGFRHMPTLIELSAPKDFSYFSMGTDLFDSSRRNLGFGKNLVITEGNLVDGTGEMQRLPFAGRHLNGPEKASLFETAKFVSGDWMVADYERNRRRLLEHGSIRFRDDPI